MNRAPARVRFLSVTAAIAGALVLCPRAEAQITVTSAEPMNLGSGREISIRDLTSAVARHVGFSGSIRWDASQPNGQPRRCLDTSRARDAFGFVAGTDFDEGLRRTVEWFVSQRRATGG